MTGWSGNGNQFTVRIFDKGGNTDLYYGQYAWYPTVISNMIGTFSEGQPQRQEFQNMPFGPYFFRAPMIILVPGVLQVQITNVEQIMPTPLGINKIQILFSVAVPRNSITQLNTNVGTSSPQTYAQSLSPLVSTAAGVLTGGS